MPEASYLLILGEREAIRWVLTTQRMAFPANTRAEVTALREGDQLFLLSTRGAFRNPTRDRTRVFGTATALTAVEPLDEPLEIAGRMFARGCAIEVESLAPYLGGLEVAPLVGKLSVFRRSDQWGMYLRRPLLRLAEDDAELIRRELRPLVGDPREVIADYRTAIRPPES